MRSHTAGHARLGRGIVLAGVLALVMAAPASADGHRTTVDVEAFDGSGAQGTATLTRTPHGVSLSAHTEVGGELFVLPFGVPLGVDWAPGDASTVWWVVFNAPGNCTDPCGEDDVIAALGGANDAEIGIHYAAGHVAQHHWRVGARLAEWDTGGAIFGMPLKDSSAAEVHVVFRSHGPAANLAPGEVAAAIHSIDGGCATNTCGDAQGAVFLP